jgi:hypothetical protein
MGRRGHECTIRNTNTQHAAGDAMMLEIKFTILESKSS